MRVAFASMASKTGFSSPGELEMTLQHFGSRRLLLQRLGELAGPLVELLSKLGCRGTATAGSRRLLAALGLRRLAVRRFHCSAARPCAGPTGGRATGPPPIGVKNLRRFS